MIRKILMMTIVWLTLSGLCAAQPWEIDLSAGTDSLTGGIHHKRYLTSGFMKLGGEALSMDSDNMNYSWGAFKFAVGSETLITQGLTCEVGLKAIYGTAEDNGYSGDVSAVAFTASALYLFPRRTVPIPLELFGGLTYAPDSLSFNDTEKYSEINIGVGFRIIENASITLDYHNYTVDMKDGPGDWELDDDSIRIGIVMRF